MCSGFVGRRWARLESVSFKIPATCMRHFAGFLCLRGECRRPGPHQPSTMATSDPRASSFASDLRGVRSERASVTTSKEHCRSVRRQTIRLPMALSRLRPNLRRRSRPGSCANTVRGRGPAQRSALDMQVDGRGAFSAARQSPSHVRKRPPTPGGSVRARWKAAFFAARPPLKNVEARARRADAPSRSRPN